MSESKRAKIGLCLSGGGFRAALFHIGALAALAEHKLLHQVEVISTVSGGSIIGAFYYLKLKRLLEGRVPGTPDPSPEAYVQIVQEIEADFLTAVQENIRLRLFSNPLSNWRMASEKYSRSDRLAELLDEYFFDAAGEEPSILLKNIHIRPAGRKILDFEAYNQDAIYKLPKLVINATCLNTGHPWHFSGDYIGEPATQRHFVREVDSNFRLPPVRFDGFYQDDVEKSVPLEQRRRLSDTELKVMATIKLSEAVAASAAVPGIFPPLMIHDLYTTSDYKPIVVELSDGGVFDNQGVSALYQQRCTHVLISDASGQLEDQAILGGKFYQVIQRANDIMMNKIRSETLYRVHAGWEVLASLNPDQHKGMATQGVLRENRLDGYALIHLREKFNNTHDQPSFTDPINKPEGAVYRLSGIRTDLDSFSDAEGYALMYDAYGLMRERLAYCPWRELSGSTEMPNKPWKFLAMCEVLRDAHRRQGLQKRLRLGRQQFFRALSVKRGKMLFALMLLPLMAGLAGGWWLLCQYWASPEARQCLAGWCSPAAISWQIKLEMTQVLYGLLGALALLMPMLGGVQAWLNKVGLVRWVRPRGVDAILGIGVAVLLTAFALLVAIYRKSFDRLFLKDGQIENL